MVRRLSAGRMKRLLFDQKNNNDDATYIIKFYNNKCHYCRELHHKYIQLSESEANEDLLFCAFNVWDDPTIEKMLNFKGVPTIGLVSRKRNRVTRIDIMGEPTNPDSLTYYTKEHIQKFLDTHRSGDYQPLQKGKAK